MDCTKTAKRIFTNLYGGWVSAQIRTLLTFGFSGGHWWSLTPQEVVHVFRSYVPTSGYTQTHHRTGHSTPAATVTVSETLMFQQWDNTESDEEAENMVHLMFICYKPCALHGAHISHFLLHNNNAKAIELWMPLSAFVNYMYFPNLTTHTHTHTLPAQTSLHLFQRLAPSILNEHLII